MPFLNQLASLKVSVIYIKVLLSMLQPGYLTFTWSSSTLFNPLSPHPSLLPDLPAVLLLIPPSSSSPAGGLRPQNWKISNTHFLIPHPINARLSLSQWSFIIILSPFFHKPYSLFCSCFQWSTIFFLSTNYLPRLSFSFCIITLHHPADTTLSATRKGAFRGQKIQMRT